ncbi:MAG: ATP-binding protein [Deltaproteobacteria bacterium]
MESNRTKDSDERDRKSNYAKLFRKFIFLTVICSLVPLLLVGWGINLHYTRFAKSRMVEQFKTQVDHHLKIIELFLQERSSRLKLIAHTHYRDSLLGSKLREIFSEFNEVSWSFTDIGIIDVKGNHLAYIGPYDLMDKNYKDAFWFNEVMSKGIYISDMFMGFRNEPHFIIAVTGVQAGEKWILRATIDTEVFRSLVEGVTLGKSGEVFLLNRHGVYQTSPRSGGRIMEASEYAAAEIHPGTQVKILEGKTGRDGVRFPKRIVAQAWLQEPRWLLVVTQDYAEALSEVNYANTVTFLFLHVSALIIVIVTLLVTRYMITTIKRRDEEANQLNRQLIQASKLASIGELSAGVAHEINNPLAIILTERQILLDLEKQTQMTGFEFKTQFQDSMNQIDRQIKRCKRITHNLLRFARRTQSIVEPVNLNEFLNEIIELMEREAQSNGIKITHSFDASLPLLLSDPSQLQQVFLNLITNAIDAHEGKPYGKIHIRSAATNGKGGVSVNISDTGSGIAPENLEKIFDPFFTTKPVGKGTGLGLSICYSIIRQLGGDISVTSQVGLGTEFVISLPIKPPRKLMESMAGS